MCIMLTYREKDLWRLNLLILRRSLPVLLGTAGLVFLAWPLSCVPDFLDGKVDKAVFKALSMLHGILPFGAVLLCMLLLSLWTDAAAGEVLRSVFSGKAPLKTECLWVLRFYLLLCAVPVAAVCRFLSLSPWEYARFLLEVFFAVGFFLLLLILSRLATVSGLIVWSYALFSKMFCGDSEKASFCLIRSDLSGEAMTRSDWLPLLAAAVFLWGAAWLLERRKRSI